MVFASLGRLWKSQNIDKLNEHELSCGPLSANTRWTLYILWPVRNELRVIHSI